MEAKAQVAMEYMLVLALILIVIVPATYVFYTYSQSSVRQIDEAQLTRFGQDIITTAENVYYLGSPSAIVVEGQMPSNVRDIKVISDISQGVNELVFYVDRDSKLTETVFSSQVE